MNRKRHWQDGMVGALPDSPRIRWRVTKGNKGPDDLVLWLRTDDWRKVPMSLACLETDFFFENEEVLFPPPRYMGGRYFMNRLQTAVTDGWEKAAEMNGRERAAKYGQPFKSKPHVDPPQHCPACGQTTTFWKRESAQAWVCGICDPVELRTIG